MSDRAQWKTRTGFLLAALGSAIGLGNIWRFPYMCYRNGGGAFLIPYFVALFVVGIPLLMLEFGLGHRFRRAVPQALGKIDPRFSWLGWWSVCFVMFGIVAYYAVVISWCGNYLVFTLTQPWETADGVNRFFDEDFLGISQGGESFQFYVSDEEQGSGLRFGRLNWQVLIGLAVVWFANWLITRRHLQAGVELASKLMIPLLIALTLVMVIWSWSFEGAAAGREIYLTPNWSQVFQTQTWVDAFSQIFFTLSLAFGIMVAYGSYLPDRTDIPTNAFLAAMGNCVFSIVASFAVFAAIGLLAEREGLELTGMLEVEAEVTRLEDLRQNDAPAFALEAQRYDVLIAEQERNQQFQTQMSTFGLLFKTYPAILTEMGPVTGRVFGLLFFLTLVVAGLSSTISIVEGVMAALTDQFHWSRNAVSAILCSIAFVLGVVFCFQSGLFWLDLVDHFITTYGLVVVGIGEALIVGWFYSSPDFRSHLDEHRVPRFGRTIDLAMRILITAMLMLTWYGLNQLGGVPLASGIARIALLVATIFVWVDKHWFDFDVRFVVPLLLIVLLDQSLVAELRSPYGGYPAPAIVGIGVTWLAATALIAWIVNRFPSRRESSD